MRNHPISISNFHFISQRYRPINRAQLDFEIGFILLEWNWRNKLYNWQPLLYNKLQHFKFMDFFSTAQNIEMEDQGVATLRKFAIAFWTQVWSAARKTTLLVNLLLKHESAKAVAKYGEIRRRIVIENCLWVREIRYAIRYLPRRPEVCIHRVVVSTHSSKVLLIFRISTTYWINVGKSAYVYGSVILKSRETTLMRSNNNNNNNSTVPCQNYHGVSLKC